VRRHRLLDRHAALCGLTDGRPRTRHAGARRLRRVRRRRAPRGTPLPPAACRSPARNGRPPTTPTRASSHRVR
jgi:hypothetical protein